jgi:molybdate transport system substrate-binding protein
MAAATPVRLMSALAVKGVLTDTILPSFSSASGVAVEIEWAPTSLLMEAVGAGRRADVILVMADAMQRLVAEEIVRRESRIDLAEAVVGLAIRKGADRPDISTLPAFEATLTAARSIVYSRSGASGIHFLAVIERLGIADRIAGQLVEIPDGLTAVLVAEGRAELAVQQVSELMQVADIDVVGSFPREVECVARLSAGAFTDAANAPGAAKLLAALVSPEAMAAYRLAGLRPARF